MLSETAPTEENACSFKEISSSMDPYCADENLSISLQSYDPFCVTSDGYFKSSAPLGTGDLVGAFSSLTIIESSGQKDDEGKDTVRFGGAFVTECPDVICSSPRRRSSRKCKTKQEVQKEKTGKKCRKTTEKKPSLDLILLKVARRRRSFLCKRARSSVWGVLGNIPVAFEQNMGRDVNQTEHKKSGKGSRGRGSGKRSKNMLGGRSRKPKGKNPTSTTGIRLKVKLGKQVVNQSCLLGMVPAAEDGPNNFWETCLDSPKLSNGIEDKLEDKVLGIRGLQCCDEDNEKGKIISNASVLDMHIVDKELENNLVNEKLAGDAADNHHPVPYQTEAGGLGLAVDSRYLDAGTSPDSEVINLIPDTQIGGRIQEDLHDILISSQDCDAPRYVRSLKLHRMNSKKGKKKGKLPQASCCTVEDGISAPEIINKSRALEKHGQRKKGEDICSTEVSIATIAVDASCNTSSSLPSLATTDFGVNFESVKVENVTEVNPNSRLSVGLASPELQFTENLLTYTKSEGRRLSKCSKSNGVSKRSAEKPDAVKSMTGNACRQKKNRANSVSKISEKGCEKVVCNVECHLDTGTYMVDDLEKNISNKSTSEGIFSSEVVPSGGSDQSLLPRNAWVRCDDCFKWRRIPSTLADSIEETNCKWICKDNLDTAFADCSIPQEKSNSEINAELEISDASCEEDASDARMSSKRSDKKHLTVPQQSSWMLIKSNLFLHRSRKTQTIDEVMVCHCKLPPEGRMGCGDGCLNRILNIECVKGTCPCGEICTNQQFQKRKYAKLRWFRCGKKGYGLQLLEDISIGQFLIEYVGEVLDMQAYEKRQRDYAARGHKHFYFMTLNGSEVIDACAKGNLGRFINHSCDPNCRTEKWMVNGEVCIGLFALRDIKKGEEVTFDYNYVRVFGAAAKKCVCGSSQCRGFIGGDPLKSEVIVQGDSDDEYPEPVMINEDGEVDDNLDDLISASTSLDGAETQTSENILKDKAEIEKPATAFGHLVTTTRMQNGEILLNDRNEINKSTSAVGYSDIVAEYDDSTSKSAYAVSQLHISSETEGSERKLPSSLQPDEPSSQADDVTSKTTPSIWEDHSIADETVNKSSSVQRPEISSLTTYHRKSLSDTTDMKKKSKSDIAEERRAYIKSCPLMKTFRSSSVKKGKSNSNSLSITKLHMLAYKSHVQPHKPKKPLDGSLSNRFEAVEEKLNELLDSDGGISKRKDAPKVYLKLLLLTAASGDSGNGEAIQSNRDLSMILDALLKTKSRMVLGDIINKNGLQMLHNIMKRYRRDFNKIPILRKLLKVLEYLALREILTLDHINGGPPCPGVESFRESILTLTEHDDKQVHQIARNFRDRWIPRSVRKVSCMERDDGKADCHRYPNCNRFSASHAHWRDQGGKSTETNDCIKQSTTPVDSCISEGCSASCSSGGDTNGTKIRKRKSRWDQPADPPRSPQHKELKIQHNFLKNSCSTPQPEVSEVGLDHINGGSREQKYCPDPVENFSEQIEAKTAAEGRQNMDEDLPPGFLPPRNGPSVSSNASSTAIDLSHRENVSCVKCPKELVMGFPQARFLSRVSLSYGIPISVLQQYGTPQAENVGRWIIAPGVPFHPFPPLPPYPREMGDTPTCIAKPLLPENVARVSRDQDNFQPDQETPSTSGAGLPYFDIACANDQNNFQRARGSSNLGTRYFRQQKWNNTKFGPPWIRKRNGWAPMGNNFRGGMCSMGVGSVAHEFKGPYSSENVGPGVESSCNPFYGHP